VGDLIVIGQHKQAEPPKQDKPVASLRLPLKIDGRAGHLCIPQGQTWTPIQKFEPDGTRLYAELGPGWVEWEDEQPNGAV
jgi:hypothetical protein